MKFFNIFFPNDLERHFQIWQQNCCGIYHNFAILMRRLVILINPLECIIRHLAIGKVIINPRRMEIIV